MKPIVLDAMGSEIPDADVAGAWEAVGRGISVMLVGDKARIEHVLAGRSSPLLTIVDEPHRLSMEEGGLQMIRRAQDERHSIGVGLDLVKSGEAGAFVSAGNTGAVVTAAKYRMGMLPNVDRPALAANLPSSVPGHWTLYLDAGAFTDPRKEHMHDHARLGALFAGKTRGLDAPRIALLANGTEPGKGSKLSKEVFKLLSQDSRLPGKFVGNIEPKGILAGDADVVVVDGYAGNLVMKAMEAASRHLFREVKSEIQAAGWHVQGAAMLVKPAMQRVKQRNDPDIEGAAPLLGVDGLVCVGHGESSPAAIANALSKAAHGVRTNVMHVMKQHFSAVA